MLHLSFLLPVSNIYFIINFIIVLIINITWIIFLVMLKTQIFYQKFDTIYYILYLYYNLLSNNIENVNF